MDTKSINERFQKAISEYKRNIQKTSEISKRNEAGELVTKEEINWLCSTLIFRTAQVESSLYDH